MWQKLKGKPVFQNLEQILFVLVVRIVVQNFAVALKWPQASVILILCLNSLYTFKKHLGPIKVCQLIYNFPAPDRSIASGNPPVELDTR